MSTATFVKSDTSTKGTWYNGTTPVYGGDGYGVFGQGGTSSGTFTPGGAADHLNYPAYATVTIGGGTSGYCWVNPSSDARALLYAPPQSPQPSGTEAAYYASPSFTLDISDGSNHQISLYFCDYDFNNSRAQTITITDDNNGNAQLDQRSISSFSNGIWLVWDVSGKVTFTFAETSGANAVVSGIFFDPAPATPAVFPPFVSRPRFEPAFYE